MPDKILQLRTDLLVEKMSRGDKKDIEKMIAKALKASESKQKTQMEKFVKDQVTSAKMKKTIAELVEKELASGFKSKDNKDVIVDVTKKVLVRLYRELAYNYTPVIDRIKI